jgi:hypothetical protein
MKSLKMEGTSAKAVIFSWTIFLWHFNLLIMYTHYIHMWWRVLEEKGDFFPRLFEASLRLVRKVIFTKVQFTESIIHVIPFRLWVLALKFFAVYKLFSLLFSWVIQKYA